MSTVKPSVALFEEEGVTVEWDGTQTKKIGLRRFQKDVELPHEEAARTGRVFSLFPTITE